MSTNVSSLSMMNSTHRYPVLAHSSEGERYQRLRLKAPEIARDARPGQYLHLLTGAENAFEPLLRRAFSVLQCGDDWVEILYRVEGVGTQQLATKRVGDWVDALGPLGRPFTVPSSDDKSHLFLVGGGVGVPPLHFLAQICHRDAQDVPAATQSTSETGIQAALQVEAFIGARGADDVLLEAEMRSQVAALWVATEDGSVGEKGFVTAPLEKRLGELAGQLEKVQVCACGPLGMLRAVALLCEKMGVACQVSLEENMPCGIGVCNGCVVPVRTATDDYGRYRRICVDGPVMDAREVLWQPLEVPPSQNVDTTLRLDEDTESSRDEMESAPHRGASQ